MRLLNHTLMYLSVALLFIIGIWAVIFYFSMLDEIYDSIDDGLDNYKVLIIQKAEKDSSVLGKHVFDESNYFVRQIDGKTASGISESYRDTLMYMENEKELEPVRLLRSVFSHGGKYYELNVIASMVEEDDLIKDLLYYIIVLYIVIIASVIVINNFLLRRIWHPFYDLISKLRQFNLKKGSAFSVPQTRVLEFAQLNETVMTLLNKNIEVYNSQKQFIENVSHESQTPLAISINKLELILEELQDEKSAQGLSEVIHNLERLTRLNKSLLLLSKIENKQFTGTEEVVLNTIIKELLHEFRELMEFKNLHVSLSENGVFTHVFDRDLVLILFTNLLKNAIVHNVNGGEIEIQIDTNQVHIANGGEKIALDEGKIFGRFYKATNKSGSTGLGLAIVKAICDIHHLGLNYSYIDGKHVIVISK